ncbi:MAG: hypothetical protein DMG14_15230 [Acidobacteria bacterium]|nr:MAG: hypothetical protein DMG14_15230 [Acidobacteriota bacterium]
MRFKGTAALFLVFVVLGGYVYFTEFRGKEERQKQEQAKKKVFPVEDKDVTEITLVYPDRTITGVKKGEKHWEMTSPPGIEADSDEWEQLASNIPRIEREDTVAQNVQDLAQFGLKDPPVKLSAKTKDGKTLELVFGAENPKKTYNYAKLPAGNDVFLTASNWAKTFTKNVSDLRNKKILEFETDDIDNVKIIESAKELEAQKSGEDWQLKKPIETKGDNSEISSFISSMRFARVNSFPESPVDAKTAGLEPPAIRITLHDGKAKADRTLLIGKTSSLDRYYARDGSRDTIFIIDKEIAEKARKPVFDWRDKSVTKLDRDKIDKIEIVRGTDMIALLKAGSDWKLPDNKKLQWDKISGMLNALDFEKAKDIIDAPKTLSTYALDKPKLEVVLRQGSNELVRIAFGNESKMPEGIYLKTSDSPAVKVVSKDVFDKFNVKADDLVETEKPKP